MFNILRNATRLSDYVCAIPDCDTAIHQHANEFVCLLSGVNSKARYPDVVFDVSLYCYFLFFNTTNIPST
jgi:hypothetical protein